MSVPGPGLAVELAGRVRRAVVEADPEAFESRRAAAVRGRRVELFDNVDGTRDLAGRGLPADAADGAFNYVNALSNAIKADGDQRPLDAIRADVLLELLRGRAPADLHSTRQPGEPARAPRHDAPAGEHSIEAAAVTEVVREQITELLGQVRDSARPDRTRLLMAEAARRIKDAVAALKAGWCAASTDAQGNHLHGHGGYRPPAAMRRLVIARDHTCRFPSCRAPATRCDHDHTLAHHRGGPTCPCNLALLCRRHHRLKQRPHWTLTQPWPGVLVWTTPTGHTYTVGPDPG
jgi:hypothetical protein